MKFDFTGKRVLVTGGTRGIGRSIVEAFLEAGARVALHGSNQESVDTAAKTIGGSQRVLKAAGALATVEGCRRVIDAALSGIGGLDVLVNNAGRWNGVESLLMKVEVDSSAFGIESSASFCVAGPGRKAPVAHPLHHCEC